MCKRQVPSVARREGRRETLGTAALQTQLFRDLQGAHRARLRDRGGVETPVVVVFFIGNGYGEGERMRGQCVRTGHGVCEK